MKRVALICCVAALCACQFDSGNLSKFEYYHEQENEHDKTAHRNHAGDCAGIGPEIVNLALKSGRVPDSAEYVVIGRQPNCKPGEPTIETARTAATALEEAVTLARRGELNAIVTGPVHKARMYEAGFKFPGQTEFFAERCGIKNFAMCLTGGRITVALVTIHLPLSKVSTALKQSEIARIGLLLAEFLRSRSKNPPRIAVAGLNPHAGESGKFGREEIDVIARTEPIIDH